MKIPLDLINGVRIASPCPASWDQMAGDDRVRHCSLCDHAVYDLSAMTAAEVAQLVGANDEDVCVRLYRRADGTVMTKDCPKGIAAGTIAVISWVAVAAVSLLGLLILRGSAVERGYKMGKMAKPPIRKSRLQDPPQCAEPVAPE